MEFVIILIVLGATGFLGGANLQPTGCPENRHEKWLFAIEIQLKRRYDLIPNLVETAKKAHMSHERKTLEAVINACNDAAAGLAAAAGNPGDANAIKELAGAERPLSGAMSRFNVTMEAYPDLKASANMTQLSEELTSTENKVAFARQAFNDQVTELTLTEVLFHRSFLPAPSVLVTTLHYWNLRIPKKFKLPPKCLFSR